MFLAADRASHSPDRSVIVYWLTAGVLVMALVFGGGTTQGLATDAAIELASLPLLVMAIARWTAAPHRNRSIVPVGLLVASVLLILIQLIPLPPFLWSHLPGRDKLADVFVVSDQSLPWWPISMDPAASVRSFLSLLPGSAIFLALLTSDNLDRRDVTLLFLAFAAVSVVLGLAQVSGAVSTSLYFYERTNLGSTVGFFANRNHYAALLYCALPFAMAWTVHFATNREREGYRVAAAAAGILASLLLLTLAISLSRSGVLLGIVGLALSALMFRTDTPNVDRKKVRWVIGGAAVLAGLLIANFALLGLIDRFVGASAASDYRGVIWWTTLDGILALLPFGSGFGTYVPVYRWFEHPETMTHEWVNRAHNDFLELGIEGGLFAYILIGLFLWWYGRTTFRLWRSEPDQRAQLDVNLAKAASISIGLLLIHSATDYPLRTLAIQAVFALLCALLVPPICHGDGTVQKRRRKRRRQPGSKSGSATKPPPRTPPRTPPSSRPSSHGPGSSVVWTD